MTDKEYKINITPRILELLGPSLYTNLYFVLAELVANAYDAGAHNVYIIEKNDSIAVEDDGKGMSYVGGDIEKYLGVAVETRTNEQESYVNGTSRRKMGRKGVGKLAALSVSENVPVMTIKNGEKSGFVLSRSVGEDHKLKPLSEEEIKLEYINGDGTSIVMTNPQYGLNKTAKAIKKNLLKIFPLINKDFKIHIITPEEKISIEDFDKEMIENLGALMVFGEEFYHLSEHFNPELSDKQAAKDLIKKEDKISIPLKLKNKYSQEKDYVLTIKGWVGAYKTTRGRKDDPSDFPDNFISILSNGKLGEYNVLPTVGKNYLSEVYLVGQLHVDLLEETELPDIALSNRQGYKTDDGRYGAVISFVRDLIPKISKLRTDFVRFRDREIEKDKGEKQKSEEENLRNKVEYYKKTISKIVTDKISESLTGKIPEGTQEMIENEMNKMMPLAGLKTRIDSQKRKILICHTGYDKPLADIIYKMLSFNNIPDDEIIYTSSDNEKCWVPYGKDVWEYLREFFVDSYSDKKIYVIYVTSGEMEKSWGAVSEVGAGWITESKHNIFNIEGHTPQHPLNIGLEWHTSKRQGDNISMRDLEFEKFIVKIIEICKDIGYVPKDKASNKKCLSRLVTST